VETSEGTAWYPCVIIATGKFGNPIIPYIEGQETFEGRLMHSQAFRDPEAHRGERVLIAGNGPSGVDIAVALAGVAARPVLLSIRSDLLIARRYPYGLPDGYWRVLLRWLPERISKPLNQHISWHPHRDVGVLGVKRGRNRVEREGTSAPVRGRELIDAVKRGEVRTVAGLSRLYGRCAILNDTSQHEVDTVILATGYRPVLNYLDIPFETDRDGWPLRDTSENPEGMEVAGYPGLYLVGRFYQGNGPIYNMQVEARMAVAQIQRRLAEQA
jgi:cation diffusion facilitator CzcD-associated flavoprotein CzcO